MTSLTTANRMVSTLTAQNTGDEPIYVRAEVTRLTLDAQGRRTRSADDDGAISVFPSEFVVRPRSTFRVRVVANPALVKGRSQSYYVRFSDVSATEAEPSASGVQASVTYSFDALVNVLPATRQTQNLGSFVLATDDASRRLALVNQTERHVYVEEGFACPRKDAPVQECMKLDVFPRQSMLPDERLPIPPVSSTHLAILYRTDLTATSGDNLRAAWIPVPVADVPTRPPSDGVVAKR
jgi:P pilus assembly chaperone PapD